MSLRRGISQLIISALLLFSLFALSGNLLNASAQGVDPRLVARAEQISQDSFPVQMRTPRGVRVFSYARTRPEMLRAIDDGFSELFAVARRHGYSARLDY